MIAITPGPHSPRLGPKVFTKTPNYRYGYTVHAQGYGVYRVIAWFDLGDGNRAYKLHTKVGLENAKDQGDYSLQDLIMEFWPTSHSLTQEIKVIVPDND